MEYFTDKKYKCSLNQIVPFSSRIKTGEFWLLWKSEPILWVFLFGLLSTRLPWWLRGKKSACPCRICGFNPWVGKIPWRRKWKPTPVSLPGKFHRQRSLVATVHGVTKESDRHDLVTKQQKLHIYQLDQRLSEQLPGLLFFCFLL